MRARYQTFRMPGLTSVKMSVIEQFRRVCSSITETWNDLLPKPKKAWTKRSWRKRTKRLENSAWTFSNRKHLVKMSLTMKESSAKVFRGAVRNSRLNLSNTVTAKRESFSSQRSKRSVRSSTMTFTSQWTWYKKISISLDKSTKPMALTMSDQLNNWQR